MRSRTIQWIALGIYTSAILILDTWLKLDLFWYLFIVFTLLYNSTTFLECYYHPRLFKIRRWYFIHVLKYDLMYRDNKSSPVLAYPLAIWYEFEAPDIFASGNRIQFSFAYIAKLDEITESLMVDFKNREGKQVCVSYDNLESEEVEFINKTLNKN